MLTQKCMLRRQRPFLIGLNLQVTKSITGIHLAVARSEFLIKVLLLPVSQFSQINFRILVTGFRWEAKPNPYHIEYMKKTFVNYLFSYTQNMRPHHIRIACFLDCAGVFRHVLCVCVPEKITGSVFGMSNNLLPNYWLPVSVFYFPGIIRVILFVTTVREWSRGKRCGDNSKGSTARSQDPRNIAVSE